MAEEIEYFEKKHADRTYISKPFDASEDDPRQLRIISKVFDTETTQRFARVKEELVIRVTERQRQEVKAVFYEDDRSIETLTIQRYTREGGKPLKTHFSFSGDEIRKLYQLIRRISLVPLEGHKKERLDDDILDDIIATVNQKRQYFLKNPDLVIEVVRNGISKSDVVALAYRKGQLGVFERLLNEEGFIAARQMEWNKRGVEAVWQAFFERNPWIFGYGLQYIYTSNLIDRQLEQIVAGATIAGKGKRADALLKTVGAISSLCFVELKTHKTELLSGKEYRGECWPVSRDLAGAVSQAQKTGRKAVETLKQKWIAVSEDGSPTGETAYLIHPKSFVVIGRLDEFMGEHGVNERKFSSFELFRGNLLSPEVITFDELFERARCIVQHSEEEDAAPDENEESPEETRPEVHAEVRELDSEDVSESVPF